MVLEGLYTLTIQVLTFWMPTIYTFKFLMEKDTTKIPTILKFWCMISCYNVISMLLSFVFDENIFPFVNLVFLIVLNLPPYEITEKIYNSTLGTIYRQNKESFSVIEEKLINLFNKNTETLKNKVKDSTSDKIQGVLGGVMMATLKHTQESENKKKKKKSDSSDDDSDKTDN